MVIRTGPRNARTRGTPRAPDSSTTKNIIGGTGAGVLGEQPIQFVRYNHAFECGPWPGKSVMAADAGYSDAAGAVLLAISQMEGRPPYSGTRRHPRVEFRRTVDLVVLSLSGDAVITAHGRDISQGGLGFVSRRIFTLQEMVAVRLPHDLVLSEVRYCEYISHGIYAAGVSFLDILKADPATPVPMGWVRRAGGKVSLA